mgnify:CR=1 FL=1
MVFRRRGGSFKRYTRYRRPYKTQSTVNYSEYRTTVNNLDISGPLKYQIKCPKDAAYTRSWRLKWMVFNCTLNQQGGGLASQVVMEIGDQKSKTAVVVSGTVSRLFLRNNVFKDFTSDLEFVHAEVNNIGNVPVVGVLEICWQLSNNQMNALKVEQNDFVTLNYNKENRSMAMYNNFYLSRLQNISRSKNTHTRSSLPWFREEQSRQSTTSCARRRY